MKKSMEHIPKALYLEITNACNLRCVHCYNCSGYEKTQYISYESILEILSPFNSEIAKPQITLSGGEPLCHPRIYDIISYLSDHDFPVYIITNGLLAMDHLLPIVAGGYSRINIQLSLSGVTPEINDRIRGDGHFEKAMMFLKSCSQVGYNRLMVRMTVSRINKHEAMAFLELCRQYNVIPAFGFLSRDGMADANWDMLCLNSEEKMELSLKLNAELKRKRHLWMNENVPSTILQPSPFVCEIVTEDHISAPAIKPNGDVQPCQRLYRSEYSIGNIYDENILTVISSQNPKVVRLKEVFKERYRILKEKYCTNCVCSNFCKGGCPAQSNDHGSLFEQDGDCDYKKNRYITSFFQNQLKGKTE